jgi:hypothetical protein
LKHCFDLLGLAVVGEEVEEGVEIAVGEASRFENRHFEPFFGGSEVVGVEAIAFHLVGGGEVLERTVKHPTGWWGQALINPVCDC